MIRRLPLKCKLNMIQVAAYKTETPEFGFKPINREPRIGNLQTNKLKDEVCIGALKSAYQEHGHHFANVNPLEKSVSSRESVFEPEMFGLSPTDSVTGSTLTARDLVNHLTKMYCKNLTAEVGHIMSTEEREWFCTEYERISQENIPAQERLDAAILMRKSEVFDEFLATKFSNTKRYGGEGAEAMMAFFDKTFRSASAGGVEQVVMCMPHRGRLNLLATMLELPAATMFRKIKGLKEWPENIRGAGDVLSHLSNSTHISYEGKQIYVTMIPNPSHLEANNPVAVGKTRAKQRINLDGDYAVGKASSNPYKVLCLQVHGDASFSGQGIVAETFGLSGVPHFNVGGSIHLIVNNQIGYTTEAERGRTSKYASCLGKMNSIPIIRVNGESPEDVMKAAHIAVNYRNRYYKDIIIDMICYRRWGHNELDNPSFTQPIMYKIIDSMKTLPKKYIESFLLSSPTSEESINQSIVNWRKYLQAQYDVIDQHVPKANHCEKLWAGMVQASDSLSVWDTGVSTDLLQYVAAKSVTAPENFSVHPTLSKTHIHRRLEKSLEGKDLDWATAEAMAFGSLLCQGYDVRICGQDVGRGTFSHRHVMLVDQETDAITIPLNNLYENQANFLEVVNSTLSEEAVLGYEYGFSIESPKCLTIWEAQFGDFFNGAQIIIDTYITSAEAKWLLQSGLVMLLPTGMDGTGPEHSSCRLERFLQGTDSSETKVDGDSVNMSVVHPTTPAQYFHLLRRQMIRNFRKPLIVAAPKVLLRLAAATSSLHDMAPGTHFHPVLFDLNVKSDSVKKIIFCSGKHFYTLDAERKAKNLMDVALVRVEELCPFPTRELQTYATHYPKASEFVWAQEEHRNAGCWSFVKPRFENLVGINLKYAGRDVLATPATGIGRIHHAETKAILDEAFA